MRFFIAAFVATCSAVAASAARADAPPLVPVQGSLSDAAGTPRNGSFTVRFRLYTSDTATTPVFDETSTIVADQGLFVHYLGSVEALDLGLFRDNPTLFLGLQIGSDAEAAPRIELASIPFAAFSQYCGDARTLGGLTPSALRDYGQLVNVPSAFPPTTHGHSVSEVSGAQAVLAGACNPGSSIRSIDPTGAIVCETDDDVLYTSGVGVVVGADHSISLDETVVRDACYDTAAELTTALVGTYANATHTHDASEISGIFGDVVAGGLVQGYTLVSQTSVFASSFAYSYPVASHRFVPASEFHGPQVGASVATVFGPLHTDLFLDSSELYLRAHVELPDGARPTSTTCYFSSYVGGGGGAGYMSSARIALVYTTYADFGSAVEMFSAPVNRMGLNGKFTVPQTYSAVWPGVFDSSSNVAYVAVAVAGSRAIGEVLGVLYGCDVKFTTTHPGD